MDSARYFAHVVSKLCFARDPRLREPASGRGVSQRSERSGVVVVSNQWWPDRVDLRDLTPLFWAHVLPYGEVKLNMTRRIAALNVAQTVETNAESS